MIGKTIASVEHRQWDDSALIRFTDGTALDIVGHGYDDVDIGLSELSAEEVRRRAARQQGERERRRLVRLRRMDLLNGVIEGK